MEDFEIVSVADRRVLNMHRRILKKGRLNIVCPGVEKCTLC